MKNLFQIKADYLNLINQVIENEGEFTPELLEQVQISEGELKDKAINYAYVIKNIDYNNCAIKAEINRLKQLEAANSKKIEVLEKTISNAMKLFEVDKIESETLKLSFRKSESVNIIDESKISDNLMTTKITKTPDKTAIKQALKEGAEIKGAELVINYNLQIK